MLPNAPPVPHAQTPVMHQHLSFQAPRTPGRAWSYNSPFRAVVLTRPLQRGLLTIVQCGSSPYHTVHTITAQGAVTCPSCIRTCLGLHRISPPLPCNILSCNDCMPSAFLANGQSRTPGTANPSCLIFYADGILNCCAADQASSCFHAMRGDLLPSCESYQ